MGIRKTLLIASTALVLPLAANASPFGTNAAQGLQPAVALEQSHGSDGLYHNANDVKEWWEDRWDHLSEGGEHNDNERGDNERGDWNNEEGGEDGERGDRWDEDGERGESGERGQFSWWDNDDRDGNWWNESGESGRHNWWNESGERGNNGKHKGWKHNKHDNNEGGENGRWDEKGEWGDD